MGFNLEMVSFLYEASIRKRRLLCRQFGGTVFFKVKTYVWDECLKMNH